MKNICIMFALIFLCGCTPVLMVKSESDTSLKSEEFATIVFMRSTFTSSAVGAELYEIEDGEISLVGGLSNSTKIIHKTSPGKKKYMAHGNASDFMLAEVEAGKTYYSIVRPNWGSGAFIPTPIRIDGTTDYNTEIPEFKKWISLPTVVKNEAADTWFQKNKVKVRDVYNKYWAKFSKKTEDQKRERTLSFSDGV